MLKADPLLRTKLHLPFTRPGLVSRPHLQKQVVQGLHGPLTLVAAGTVKAHTASIYRKLDVANRTEAVARARQLGILS